MEPESTRGPGISLLPLDERPVNTVLVADVAAIAGVELTTPPADALPRFREPADPAAVADWLHARAARGDDLVIALDTLVHGGLIPARTDALEPAAALARLAVLRDLRLAGPERTIAAVALVMRATDSYSPVEEPVYWADHGREIHRLGAAVHRQWLGEDARVPELPATIRDDYSARRLRNHIALLASLELAWSGVVDPLVITADDTAQFSAGSAEQEMLAYWQRLRGTDVPVYPGADETGAVLVARVIAQRAGLPIRVRVTVGDQSGLELIPSYENVPLRVSVQRQLVAVGATPVDDSPDLSLVVHTPDPAGGDHFGGTAVSDPEATMRTADAVDEALAAGAPVALADVRFGNGGDPALIAELARRGSLERLAAYAGWNTAGNALGSTLALGVAAAVGDRRGTRDLTARRRALQRRLLDDVAYQAIVRAGVTERLGRIDPVPSTETALEEERIAEELPRAARSLGIRVPDPPPVPRLPWSRSFEIDLRFADERRP